VIPMNGFNYEIWRPGPPQDERAAFVTNLGTAAAGGVAEQDISLPVEAARMWLTHTLTTYRRWQVVEGPLEDSACVRWLFEQSGETIRATLCSGPDVGRSHLELRGEPM